MLCILAVFIAVVFHAGGGPGMFVPLSLAVGFSMMTSYFLSSTFVPVCRSGCCGTCRTARVGGHDTRLHGPGSAAAYQDVLAARSRSSVPCYLVASPADAYRWSAAGWGREIFPFVDRGEFRLRLQAPDGTAFRADRTMTLEVLKTIEDRSRGRRTSNLTLGLRRQHPLDLSDQCRLSVVAQARRRRSCELP